MSRGQDIAVPLMIIAGLSDLGLPAAAWMLDQVLTIVMFGFALALAVCVWAISVSLLASRARPGISPAARRDVWPRVIRFGASGANVRGSGAGH